MRVRCEKGPLANDAPPALSTLVFVLCTRMAEWRNSFVPSPSSTPQVRPRPPHSYRTTVSDAGITDLQLGERVSVPHEEASKAASSINRAYKPPAENQHQCPSSRSLPSSSFRVLTPVSAPTRWQRCHSTYSYHLVHFLDESSQHHLL